MKKEETQNPLEKGFKIAMNMYLSIITLNVSGLNAPIKRHRVADWKEKSKNLPSAPYKKLTLEQRDGKRYFIPMDQTGKQDLQNSYQTK